ncbi:MAG: hypothetical protein V2A54_12100 [Bacteroidota bacterium]
MKRIYTVFICLFLLNTTISFADSPITSTPISEAYKDIPMVNTAAASGILNDEIAAFLLNEDNPLDQKAAVINALSWSFDGKRNAILFKEHLCKKYKTTIKYLKIDIISGDEQLCLGYLTIMDDYFFPDDAITILEKAVDKNPMSFTCNIIFAMAKAQKVMNSISAWCKVWKLAEAVETNKDLKRDMREDAIKIIMDYMILYKGSCK